MTVNGGDADVDVIVPPSLSPPRCQNRALMSLRVPSKPVQSITPIQFLVSRYHLEDVDRCSPWRGQPDKDNHPDDISIELMIEYYIQSIIDGDVDQIHQPFHSTIQLHGIKNIDNNPFFGIKTLTFP